MTIYLVGKAQIALLLAKEVTVLLEYADFVDVFLKELAKLLPERTGINEYTIKLEKGKQWPYGPIYSLGLIELETLKAYIETKLAHCFIQSLKSPIRAPIFFVQKSNGNLCLCINYWGLNNLMIKNQYILLLISKFLDQLRWAKRFTQLDLISAYQQMKIKKGNE